MSNIKPLVKNPDYENYVNAYNCAFHDYGMPESDIVQQLGKEPRKYAELNMRAQIANLSHQNREAVAKCGNEALIVYDAFMRGENNLFRAWAGIQPDGSIARQILQSITPQRELEAEAAELADLDETYAAASGRLGY